jgi:peptidyl-tRNA hydrolase
VSEGVINGEKCILLKPTTFMNLSGESVSSIVNFYKIPIKNILVLSDDIGILKPWPEIFHFALSTTQSELNNSLMIGDSWENDIVGAAGVGMHQVFYNLSGRTDLPFAPTYQITDLKDLFNFL